MPVENGDISQYIYTYMYTHTLVKCFSFILNYFLILIFLTTKKIFA